MKPSLPFPSRPSTATRSSETCSLGGRPARFDLGHQHARSGNRSNAADEPAMDPQDVSASDLPDYVVPERDVEGNLRELKDLIHCAKQRRNIAAIRALCLSSRKVFISLEEEAWQYGANSATSRDHRQRAYAHLDDAESLFQELIDRFSASAHPRLKSFFSSIAARKADIAAIN